MPDTAFRLLTDHEIAQSLSAIESVGRTGKPLAEVCERLASIEHVEDLVHDLRECLALANEEGVRGFIRRVDEARVTYGFFKHQWVIEAVEFLDQRYSEIESRHIDWIQGLLFGYRPDAIEKFIAVRSAGRASTSQHGGTECTEGTYRPYSGRYDIRSTQTPRYRIVDTYDRLSQSSVILEKRA